MASPSPFDELMGTKVVELGPDRTVVELPVTPALHQPAGIVHGGVFCALVEVAASLAAHTWLETTGRGGVIVGINNQTDFLRAVRSGLLRATAVPLQRGRRLQLWEVDVTDGDGQRVAHGKLKVMNLPEPPP